MVKIDQRAALRAGVDAPHSTARVEFFPDRVHDSDILQMVSDHLDFRSGEMKPPGDPDNRLVFTKPPTHEELVTAMGTMLWRYAASPAAPSKLRERYQDAMEATWQVLRHRETKSAHGCVIVSRRLDNGEISRYKNGMLGLIVDERENEVRLPAGTVEPAWPRDAIQSIVESEEAETWRAEIDQKNERALMEAFGEAERRLLEKEQRLAQLQAEEEAAAAAEVGRRDATRQLLSKWVQKHGTAMQKERLKRGWLPLNGLIEIVLEHDFRDFVQPLIGIYPECAPEGWLSSAVQNDREMGAVLNLESELKKAGMDHISAGVVESQTTRQAPSERVLRADFNWPKHGLEDLACHCGLESRTELQVLQRKAARRLIEITKSPSKKK